MNALLSDDPFQFNKSNALIFFALAGEAFQGFQKLAELNLQVGREVLAESGARLREMNPDTIRMDWQALPSPCFAQSAGEKALSYQRHIGEIAAETQAGLAKIAAAQQEQFTRAVQIRTGHGVSQRAAAHSGARTEKG